MSLTFDLLLFLGVLALAWAAARLLGRQPRRRSGGPLQVRDSLSLGKDRALLLIEVGDRLLLVGATPQSITLVQQLDGALAPAAAAASAPAAPPVAPAAGQPAPDGPQPAPAAPAFVESLRQALGVAPLAGSPLPGGRAALAPRLRTLASALTAGAAARLRGLAAATSLPGAGHPAEVQRAQSALRRLAESLDGAGELP